MVSSCTVNSAVVASVPFSIMILAIRRSFSVQFTAQYTISPHQIIGFSLGQVGFSLHLNPMR